jgi:hypothetical protein
LAEEEHCGCALVRLLAAGFDSTLGVKRRSSIDMLASRPRNLLRITIAERPDPTSVANVLQLNADIVGIREVQFLGIAAQANAPFYSGLPQFPQDGVCVEVVQAKAHMVDTRGPALRRIEPEESRSDPQVDAGFLSREDRHAEKPLIELD